MNKAFTRSEFMETYREGYLATRLHNGIIVKSRLNGCEVFYALTDNYPIHHIKQNSQED